MMGLSNHKFCYQSSTPVALPPADAAYRDQHQRGIRKRQRCRAAIHPEPGSVPVYLSQGARFACREEAAL